ncbi:hypothetical protein A1D22_06915 [Pasteurellaceae bacterium LFhippo2]|nr:hypothetical protein [Pasteurellaceae bacterium LFhippo2]
MQDFKSIVLEYIGKYPRLEFVELEFDWQDNAITFFSPKSKEIIMSFIQHSETHFESLIGFEFEDEKYGKCFDTIVDLDCDFAQDENGVYCKLSDHNEYYPSYEELYIAHQIKPLLDEYLTHFMHADFEFWVKKDSGSQFISLPQKDVIQAKRREKGWELLRGAVHYTDDELFPVVLEFCRESEVISISRTQRKFYLAFNQAARLIDRAKEILAKESESNL